MSWPQSPELPGPLLSEANPTPWWPMVAGLSGALLAGWLLWCFARRQPQSPPTRSASATALAQLAELRRHAPADRMALRAETITASMILRDHLEERFGVEAHAMTNRELATSKNIAVDQAAAFFAYSDRIKFGLANANSAERQRQLDLLERYFRAADA